MRRRLHFFLCIHRNGMTTEEYDIKRLMEKYGPVDRIDMKQVCILS